MIKKNLYSLHSLRKPYVFFVRRSQWTVIPWAPPLVLCETNSSTFIPLKASTHEKLSLLLSFSRFFQRTTQLPTKQKRRNRWRLPRHQSSRPRWLEDDKRRNQTMGDRENKVTFGYLDKISYRADWLKRLEEINNPEVFISLSKTMNTITSIRMMARRTKMYCIARKDSWANQNLYLSQ